MSALVTTMVIDAIDLAVAREMLREAHAFTRFGKDFGGKPIAATWIEQVESRLAKAAPKCRTSTCSEPVATLRDGSPDPSGWCWSCAEREPECSSCGDVIEDTGSLCQRCATVEHALIEADRRRDESPF